jgi:hypothetical protein
MKISGIGFDGLDHPVPSAMKFSDDSANVLKMTESERAGAYRMGEQRYQQHVQAMTAAKPSHTAIQLTDKLQKRAFALMERDATLSFSDAVRRIAAAYPAEWLSYQRAQQE